VIHTASIGSYLPTFEEKLSVPSSDVKQSLNLGDGTNNLSRNTGH